MIFNIGFRIHIREYQMMRNNTLISVEGNIGSGKSTLLCRLRDLDACSKPTDTSIHILLEPISEWTRPVNLLYNRESMLQSFYNDTQANSFAFQMFVMKTRVDQLMQLSAVKDMIISERCMVSHDKIFAQFSRSQGDISDVEWVTYRGWMDTIRELVGESIPSGIVYLRTSPHICHERMNSRNRSCEDRLSLEFLSNLHDLHESFIENMVQNGVHVLVLNGDVDGSDSDEMLQMISMINTFVEQVRQEKSGMK